jgi:cytochrome P450
VSAPAARPVLRPGPTGIKKWMAARIGAAIPFGLGLARRFWPIPHKGTNYAVTLHDDVREVYGTDQAFMAPYKAKLDVITANQPFFLGMGDTPEYHAGLEAMRRVMRADDLPELAWRAEAQAAAIVASSGGRVEVVDQLVRKITFDMLGRYLGVPDTEAGDLPVWATRLFEFQFADLKNEKALRDEVDVFGPLLRDHIDREIARRKAQPGGEDDVLGRCLALQAAGEPGYSDVQIRTNLVCMIVGGPPQPPMVVPQAMEQLLRRPAALEAAQAAARAGDDALLHDMVLEAMRFDPLAPGLLRTAVKPWTVARGTRRATLIPEGATVFVAFASAMMDERRVPDPDRFDPHRRPHEYIHFGYGLHQCFGRHINHATLHLMLKPLLKQPQLRRAKGADGHLAKNGPFAERLVVEFG